MKYGIPLAFCLLGTLAVAARAQVPSIVLGNNLLLPDTANQHVSIFVTGGEAVNGIDFVARLSDGGVYDGGVAAPTGLPNITGIDLIDGTIFGSNNTGQNDAITPLLATSSMTTSSGTVSADGLLATLTISTVGVGPGVSVPFYLDSTVTGSIDLTVADPSNPNGSIVPNVTPGTIQTVPEPTTATMAALAASGLLFSLRKFVRRR